MSSRSQILSFFSGNGIKDFFPYLVLFILAVSPSIGQGPQKNTCNVFPKDPYIEVGSDIDIVCQTCDHRKIFWTLNNSHVDKSLSKTINVTNTVLTLRNFTHFSATLQCHSEDTQLILGGTKIRTYSKPSKILCFLDHTNQKEELSPDLFTCNWEHPINKLKINYTVQSASEYWPFNCKSTKTTCTAKIYTYPIDKVVITVRAKTTAWEIDSDPVEFDPERILKIIPPNLTIDTSSEHLLVKWERASSYRECHCQVKYSKAVNEQTPEFVINETLEKNNSSGMLIIEQVESCSKYTFSARCALNEAPWSEWSREKMVLTKLNKRDVRLRLWRKVSDPEKNGVRKVHAMWTEIPSTCQGTFTYTIKQTSYKEHSTGINYTFSGNSTGDVDVNQDAHTLNLTVSANEALLLEDSVYVPAIGESLPQVTDIRTSTHEGVISVHWKAPVQPVRGYIIDWTHNGNQYCWKESKYTNTTLSDLLDKKPYNITVTPLFDDRTGHGTQALEICSRMGDPGKVTIQVQAKDRSALVSWDVKSQETCSGVVVNYTVFYSIQKGPQHNVTVNSTERSISLKDLKPDTRYSVYVMAAARTGTTKSSETLFKTTRFGLGLITAVSVSGSIIILLVLSIGCCCVVQWKKFREKPVPDPGDSFLSLWLSRSRQEGTFPSQPFHNPVESICDRVYTAETQRTSTSPLAPGCHDNPASDQTEEYTDPDTLPVLDVQNEDPEELTPKTPHLSPPDDSTALLLSENGPSSPYRSQSSVESPDTRSGKQCRLVPVKQTKPMTVYVTLDMFEQGQGR